MNIARKLILAGGLSVLLTTPALAANYALLVGAGKFQDPDVNPLPGIDLDVGMAKSLAISMGIPASNIRTLMDQQATTSNVRSALQSIADKVGRNDKVFIYVSSHGSQIPDEDGDEDDGLDETLYIYDGHLPDDDIGKMLRNIPSQNVIVVIDACHSASLDKSLGSPERRGVSKYLPPKIAATRRPKAALKAVGVFDSNEDTGGSGAVNYLMLSAAQDTEQSLATPQGSMFTVAMKKSFDQRSRSGKDFTWQDVFKDIESGLEGQSFHPNMTGSIALARSSLTPSTSGNANGSNELNMTTGTAWQKIESLAMSGEPFSMDTPSALRVGDILTFTMNLPVSGYLNLLSVDAEDNVTLLFPNGRDQQNKINAGVMRFPASNSFILRATEPVGRTLIVALVTESPLNLMEGKSTNASNLFTALMKADLQRAAKALKVEPAGYYTAKAIFNTRN